MEMKHIAWAMAGITGLIALFIVGVTMHAALSGEAPPAPGVPGGAPGSSAPANSAQERVLQGFDVAFWGEGRPFVRLLDPVSGEYDTVSLVSFLMFEQGNAESGYSDEGGYTMKRPETGAVENTYRLGLVYEHGLFVTPQNRSEALHCYRLAAQAGHKEAAEAVQRLGGAPK